MNRNRLLFIHESKKQDIKDARVILNNASAILKCSEKAMMKAENNLEDLKKSLKDFENKNFED